MASKLVHDSLHRLLILLQQSIQLPVLLQQLMVLDDDLSILPLELGLKDLCN